MCMKDKHSSKWAHMGFSRGREGLPHIHLRESGFVGLRYLQQNWTREGTRKSQIQPGGGRSLLDCSLISRMTQKLVCGQRILQDERAAEPSQILSPRASTRLVLT